MSMLPELGHADRRGIGKLVGVSPLARDSGTMRGRADSWGLGSRGINLSLKKIGYAQNTKYMTLPQEWRKQTMLSLHSFLPPRLFFPPPSVLKVELISMTSIEENIFLP